MLCTYYILCVYDSLILTLIWVDNNLVGLYKGSVIIEYNSDEFLSIIPTLQAVQKNNH